MSLPRILSIPERSHPCPKCGTQCPLKYVEPSVPEDEARAISCQEKARYCPKCNFFFAVEK